MEVAYSSLYDLCITIQITCYSIMRHVGGVICSRCLALSINSFGVPAFARNMLTLVSIHTIMHRATETVACSVGRYSYVSLLHRPRLTLRV